jgi:hypothetical protein
VRGIVDQLKRTLNDFHSLERNTLQLLYEATHLSLAAQRSVGCVTLRRAWLGSFADVYGCFSAALFPLLLIAITTWLSFGTKGEH